VERRKSATRERRRAATPRRPLWIVVVIGYLVALAFGVGYGAWIKAHGQWSRGTEWERALLMEFHTRLPAWLDTALYYVPWAGTNLTLGPAIAVAVVWLWWRARRDLAVWLAVVEVGSLSLNYFVKKFLGRPRPELWERRGWFGWDAYPSGHVIASIAVLLTIAFILHHERGWRWPFFVAALFPPMIGYSRLYDGVHWPTDIIGGAVIGAIWLIATLIAFAGAPRIPRRRLASPRRVVQEGRT
jgi:membrane-associated phospholipid phosphatase